MLWGQPPALPPTPAPRGTSLQHPLQEPVSCPQSQGAWLWKQEEGTWPPWCGTRSVDRPPAHCTAWGPALGAVGGGRGSVQPNAPVSPPCRTPAAVRSSPHSRSAPPGKSPWLPASVEPAPGRGTAGWERWAGAASMRLCAAPGHAAAHVPGAGLLPSSREVGRGDQAEQARAFGWWATGHPQPLPGPCKPGGEGRDQRSKACGCDVASAPA